MHKSVWVILLIVVLLLAACGSATDTSTGAETESGELFMIALPRIVIDIDADGNLGILGIKPASLGLTGLKLDKSFVDTAVAGGIQHVELRTIGRGIAVFVNGELMPYLGWDSDSLMEATDLAGAFNVQSTGTIKKLIPIVRRLGINIALKFPLQPSAAEIPLVDPKAPVELSVVSPDEPRTAVVLVEVKFDEQGVPGILGITGPELAEMGLNLPSVISTDLLGQLQAGNIQYMEVRGRGEGLFIYANSKPLPNIVWDKDALMQVSNLYAQIDQASPYAEIAKLVAPALPTSDIDILFHFPLAAGAQPIPVERH